jgi:hypothetical protein
MDMTLCSRRQLLRSAAGHEMRLSKVIDQLVAAYGRTRSSFYQIVASLDFVETSSSSPNGKDKVLRLKLAHAFDDRLAEINSYAVRENIQRALAYFSETDIDVGLFLLSKEFEAVLRTFIVSGHRDGSITAIPSSPLAKLRLAELITIAERNGLITDAAAVSYLRQERNERAHGSMPSAEERRALMKGAGVLAGLYIDYIALIVNHSSAESQLKHPTDSRS